MIYNLCVTLIDKYKKIKAEDKLQDLAEKIDVYYAADRLTTEQYNDLMKRLA